MEQIAVIGAGPAGLLAAISIARTGRPVVLFAPEASPRGHHSHIHRITAPVLAALDQLAGEPTEAWAMGTTHVVKAGRVTRIEDHPVVDAARLVAALRLRAGSAGVRFVAGRKRVRVEPCQQGWRIDDEPIAFAALIDASGAGRTVAGQIAGDHGFDWSIDEIGRRDSYRSWSGVAAEHMAPASWQASVDHAGMAVDLFLARHGDGHTQLTLRQPAALPMPTLADATALLHASGGRNIRSTLAAMHLTEDASGFNACAATLLALDDADLARIPPYLPIGDTLVQTHPRFGQGFAQIVAQVHALTRAASGPSIDWYATQAALLEGARTAWAAAAIRGQLLLAA